MTADEIKAMREALNAIKDTLDEWRTNGEMMEHWQYSELFGIANAALSAPLRNCDVGTVKEQAERFDEFCYNHRSREKGCGDCPLLDGGPCELAWTQMPYEEVIATISQPHRVARRNAENTEAKDPTHGAVRKG